MQDRGLTVRRINYDELLQNRQSVVETILHVAEDRIDAGKNR